MEKSNGKTITNIKTSKEMGSGLFSGSDDRYITVSDLRMAIFTNSNIISNIKITPTKLDILDYKGPNCGPR